MLLMFCALVYKNEEYVGQAIRESGLSRDELYVTTKWSFGSVEGAIQGSLAAVNHLLHMETTRRIDYIWILCSLG